MQLLHVYSKLRWFINEKTIVCSHSPEPSFFVNNSCYSTWASISSAVKPRMKLLIKKAFRYRQEQVSYEVLQTSHTFSMDNSGMQTCLQPHRYTDKYPPGIGIIQFFMPDHCYWKQ